MTVLNPYSKCSCTSRTFRFFVRICLVLTLRAIRENAFDKNEDRVFTRSF